MVAFILQASVQFSSMDRLFVCLLHANAGDGSRGRGPYWMGMPLKLRGGLP